MSHKTVQGYIDEAPRWADGTAVSSAPLTAMQQRIWFLATAGKFFEGMVVFMTGVALPLIVADFGLGSTEKGLLGAAVLGGILLGATSLGGLADHLGRRALFILELVIFVAFLIGLTLANEWWLMGICLLGMGIALGCDYPIAHLMISETLPTSARGRRVLGAFAFQAVGALVGTLVGYLILSNVETLDAWRYMYATAIIPAIVVIAYRFTITESPQWAMAVGKVALAESSLEALLKKSPPYPKKIELVSEPGIHEAAPKQGYGALFSKPHRKATALASVPWFLQDLGTYGIGIFTPTILAATFGAAQAHPGSVAELLANDMLAAKGAAFLDVLLVAGVLMAIVLVERVGRIKLQILGFVGCAVGLGLAAVSTMLTGQWAMVLLFLGFMVFNFMTNIGPNAQTYLIAGEVFPTAIRGRGAGFAASFAKIGAVLTAFLFPSLMAEWGTQVVLMLLVGTSLLGAVLTWLWQIETRGRPLDEMSS